MRRANQTNRLLAILWENTPARILAFLLVGLAVAWLQAAGITFAADASGPLKAGVAKIDITPDKPVMLSGYAARNKLSTGIHDPLSARAIVFERDGKRLMLITADIIGFGFGRGISEDVRKEVIAECRLEPSDLFLAAVHTHSAPTITLDETKGHPNNVEYTKALQPRIVELAKAAVAALAPVEIGIGSGSVPVGVNRRETKINKEGKPYIDLGRNPAGPTDPEVQVVKVMNLDTGTPLAIVFGYATHSTALGQDSYEVSGDIHGLASQFVEKHLGNGVIVPAFAGASGNIDPWFRTLPKFETANGWVPEPILMSTMLGEEVVHVYRRIQKGSADGPIRSAMKTISLPGKAREPVKEEPKEIPPTPITITVARLGDLAIVGLGGEIFCEIGREIKKASPFPMTLVITHCNGSAGYMPTRASYPDGGYEVRGSRFAPGADEKVVEEIVWMLNELK